MEVLGFVRTTILLPVFPSISFLMTIIRTYVGSFMGSTTKQNMNTIKINTRYLSVRNVWGKTKD